ncbi:MAG: efflux RND transporter periplasmic adaptor subunit [Alphaproteobacteria bacterium]|nr:efflux RND transporter periplasmic adaptor subunit [Alphaproteobacteria bacterium]
MKPGKPLFLAALAFAAALQLSPLPARAESLAVAARTVTDEKAVFATIESANVVAARVRTGGTIAELAVREGDAVTEGQTIAFVTDSKLATQTQAYDAQIAAAKAQLAEAQSSYNRVKQVFDQGYETKARLEQAEAALKVARNNLKSISSTQTVVRQQLEEGAVKSPVAGRVLQVPVTAGTVVMPGETVAQIASGDYVLRLQVPERHARFMKTGDAVRLAEPGKDGPAPEGRIVLVYPQITDGRVVADARVEGLEKYFVGERVRVWISGGERQAVYIPARFISTRFGIDYVLVKGENGKTEDVIVQRGLPRALPDMPGAIEILSGLKTGDTVVSP